MVALVKDTDHQNHFDIAYAEHFLTDDLQSGCVPAVKVYDFKQAFDPFLLTPTGISTIRACI